MVFGSLEIAALHEQHTAGHHRKNGCPSIRLPALVQSRCMLWHMQVCAEVAIVLLDENTPVNRAWFTWRDILHLADIMCCCAVLFPIVWSIKHLREASQVSVAAVQYRLTHSIMMHCCNRSSACH